MGGHLESCDYFDDTVPSNKIHPACTLLAMLEQHGIHITCCSKGVNHGYHHPDDLFDQLKGVNHGSVWERMYFESLKERPPPAMNNPDSAVYGWLPVRRCYSDCVFTKEYIAPVVVAAEILPPLIPQYPGTLVRESDMRARGGVEILLREGARQTEGER